MQSRVVLAALGPFLITAYGLCVALGAVLAVLVTVFLGSRRHIRANASLDAAICATIGAVLGARILYCLTMYEAISMDFGLGFIPRLWEGGYTLFGGVLGGLLGVALYARAVKKPLAPLLDILAPGAAVFMMIVRLAEAFTTQGLGLYIEAEALQRFPFAVQDVYGYWAMPVFLYEAFSALLIALICALLLTRAKPGTTATTFVTLLCLTQILLDSWRQDEYIRFGFVHLNQVAAVIVLLLLLLRSVVCRVRAGGSRTWQALRCVLYAAMAGVLIWVEFALDKSSIDSWTLYVVMTGALIVMGVALLHNGKRVSAKNTQTEP